MSKAKFQAARELIHEGKYDEARVLLRTIDHPRAKEWLKKLDELRRSSVSKNSKQQRSVLSRLRDLIAPRTATVSSELSIRMPSKTIGNINVEQKKLDSSTNVETHDDFNRIISLLETTSENTFVTGKAGTGDLSPEKLYQAE